MTVLCLEDVSHTFPDGPDRVTALSRIDLSVSAGELVAVMGPSGSGKTTLVNVAAGIVLPESGRVTVDGLDVGRASARRRAQLRRQRVGVVHQADELDPVLTAAENVALPLLLDGARRHAAHRAAVDALERCAAVELAGRNPERLSGGQRRRVALARAIVGGPTGSHDSPSGPSPGRRLLLADEPTAALDSASAQALVELLVVLASTGIAVLMTTHDSRLATFADRIVLLRDGRQINPGPTTSMKETSA